MTDDQIIPGDFTAWATEGLEIAESTVYPGYEFNTELSQEYLDKATPVLQAHMMLGAARLAALIEDIYGENSLKDTLSFDDSIKQFTQWCQLNLYLKKLPINSFVPHLKINLFPYEFE